MSEEIYIVVSSYIVAIYSILNGIHTCTSENTYAVSASSA